ncbi:MAG: alpha/beta hydrolase family protein [Pseudomonadota bacterium]
MGTRALALALVAAVVAAAAPALAQVRAEDIGWTNPKDGTEVPAALFYDPGLARPDGTYPAVLFVHGRRGMQVPENTYAAEVAALGFLVLAPDWQTGRNINPWPLEHDERTELDVALGLDALDALARARPGEKRILYGYSRGGYYAARVATDAVRAGDAPRVACIVAVAGHFQNPNKPEPFQAFQYMPELDRLAVPLLMVVGLGDTGTRLDNTERAFYGLVARGADVELVMLPAARRAFDLREHIPGSTVTENERLAKAYSRARIAAFMRGCLAPGAR